MVQLDVAWHAVAAFARERWGRKPANRAALLATQQRRLARFLQNDLAHVPFYAALDRSTLAALPIIDKATMLAQFERFNRHGITREQALAAAIAAESGSTHNVQRDTLHNVPHDMPHDMPHDTQRDSPHNPQPNSPHHLPQHLSAGLSSGTSGARGVFLVSPRERGTWAGVLLARVLSSAHLRQLLTPWKPPLRVAFMLRADSALYATVRHARLKLEWLPLTVPAAEQQRRLATLAPQILVAPASVLGTLARAQSAGLFAIHPQQLISVAEVLEDDDASAVRQAWGLATSQLYQCTEGFLGASCEAGHLHLNEEHVLIEPEWLDAAHTRFRPLVTDFTRHTQAFVRFRLDDVLQPLPEPCPCGRTTLALARVEGRGDDRLWLADAQGQMQPVFPDALRHAIARAQDGWPVQESLSDYRLEQHASHWLLRTQPDLPPSKRSILQDALKQCCTALGLQAAPVEMAPWVVEPSTQKRRRIRCVTAPQGTTLTTSAAAKAPPCES